MTLGLGIGLRPGGKRARRGGPQPALFWDFEHMGSLPTELAVERTGLAGMWQDDGTLGFGAHNLCPRSCEFNDSGWNKRGTTTVTPNAAVAPNGTTTADLIEGLAAGSGSTQGLDLNLALGFAGAALAISFRLKRVSTSGTLKVYNAADATKGEWTVDLALLSNEWERIKPGHPAVTVVIPFVTSVSSTGGFQWKAAAGTLSFYLWNAQISLGSTYWDDIPTTTAARYLMRFEKHPSTGRRGLVGEAASTPLLTNALWAGGTTPTSWTLAGTGTPAVASSIYGSADGAIALTFTVAAGQQYITQNLSGDGSTTYCVSSAVEANTGLPISQILHLTSGTATVTIASYMVDGVVGTSATVPAAGSKIAITYTLSGAGGYTLQTGAGTSSATTGTVTCSRPQAEASQYPTSFFAGTRSADPRVVYTLPAALQTALASGGTIFCEFAFLGGGSAANPNGRNAMCLSTGATSNQIVIYNITGGVGIYMATAGAPEYASSVAAVAANTLCKVAFAFSAGRLRGYVNGAALSLDASANLFTPTQIALLGGATGDGASGILLRRAGAFTAVLTDAELQALTAA